MPELPEVETVCRGLKPAMEGHRLTRVQTRRGDLRIPFPPGFVQHLTGRRVARLRRRAKYILGDLDNGETLVIHLGMSGRMTVQTGGGRSAEPGPHDHVIFDTDAPARIVFTDPRRFGLMTLVPTAGLDGDALFRDIGPEPLEDAFTPAMLSAALKGKKTSIKAALLDQHVVAGVGNIYACEALFRAAISPKRPAASVAGARAERLVSAIKAVLNAAIASGGSTLRDYKKSDGSLGYFQHHFEAYDHEGQPCPRPGCTGTIARIVQSGRSTFYCPRCQR